MRLQPPQTPDSSVKNGGAVSGLVLIVHLSLGQWQVNGGEQGGRGEWQVNGRAAFGGCGTPHSPAAVGMGCRLSGLLTDDGRESEGRDMPQVSRREALRILSSYEEPITLQIEGWRGRGHHPRQMSDCSTQTERSWDPLRNIGVTAGSASRLNAYPDRPCCNHIAPPRDRYRAGEYLPSIPQGIDDISSLGFQDPELSSCIPKGRSCLIGCCNANTDEPSSFLSQTEDEELVLEKPLGYLPLLHELDSGLGCTDGSLHQGELSGAETEEGVEDAVSSPPGRTSRGSPSSESLISSELSDSGFYSVSAGDFHHFQRLLERKIRLYRARVAPHHQQCDGPAARWDLESIPEVLGSRTAEGSPPTHRCSLGMPSVQLSRAPAGPGLLPQPGPSSCSTPSCQRRAALQHQNSSSVELLGRSSTLLRSTQLITDRRRASHPTSPNFRRFPGGAPPDFPEWRAPPQALQLDHSDILPREPCCSGDGSDRKGRCRRRQGGPERQCLTLGHPRDIRECWPKPGSPRGGPYSTLAGPSAPGRSSRAVRSRLLKARASRLADERSEATTDEEAWGEVQTGRYWSKAERRRHLLVAREQRRRRRSGDGAGGGASVGGGAGCSAVLELSHRKLTRLRNRKLLDDWTTVEELLTHGTRASSEEILCPSPLLSVTTV
ncbi:hypothetical protein AGOR_G00140840 [Albula goreensis]|uniref:Uncharacterized protein n=1 Tax=Albula goreensis TaxID=1534307 RepID=A0A8T3D6B2_9TELE|nr:hypothetical protein AGOR_G00140840 [Albula goreensis]